MSTRRIRYYKNPKTNRWITLNGPVWNTLTEYQKKKAKSGPSKLDLPPGSRPSKPLPKKVPRMTTTEKKKSYEKTKRMRVAKQQPLSQTLKTVPKSRKTKREKLQNEIKRKNQGRGRPTRGWGAAMPQKGKERHELREKCGTRCFLNPPEGYPVCASLRTGQGCKIDCRGVTAARIRAAQWNNRSVYRKASALEKKCV